MAHHTQIVARFSDKTNTVPLRSDEYRIWRHGESVICRTVHTAQAAVLIASRLDPSAHAVDSHGHVVNVWGIED